MGVLTQFFIATPADLPQLYEDVQPIDIFPGSNFNGVSFEELTNLLVLITQTPNMTDDDLEQDSPLVFNHDEHILVYQLPVAFRDALAAIDDSRMRHLAEAWRQSVPEDVALWDPTAVERGLRDMIGLSRQAQHIDHRLYLWHYV